MKYQFSLKREARVVQRDTCQAVQTAKQRLGRGTRQHRWGGEGELNQGKCLEHF